MIITIIIKGIHNYIFNIIKTADYENEVNTNWNNFKSKYTLITHNTEIISVICTLDHTKQSACENNSLCVNYNSQKLRIFNLTIWFK